MSYIRQFSDSGLYYADEVGDKIASLGELFRIDLPQQVKILPGFAITTAAYREVVVESGVAERLKPQLAALACQNKNTISEYGHQIRESLYAAPWPVTLRESVVEAYQSLMSQAEPGIGLAVRSSVFAGQELAGGFLGQHETFLNVRGVEMLIDACRRCFASAFTDRAIAYRIERNIDHFSELLAVGIMPMVRADLAASGLVYSIEPDSEFKHATLVSACYGLGDSIALGLVEADEIIVHKPTFQLGYRHVLRRTLGEKQTKIVFSYGRSGETVREIPTPCADRETFCVTDDEALLLTDSALRIEKHYRDTHGIDQPLVIEWAKDGFDQSIYLLQIRREFWRKQNTDTIERYRLKGAGRILATGKPAGTRIAQGKARIIADVHHLDEFQPGEILVADMTMPDWGHVMKTAAAIVTNRGGRTCHAAIVARELSIPAVIGAGHATETIKDGQMLTISCAESHIGYVYEGALDYEVHRRDLDALEKPHTNILISLGNPDRAFALSQLPNDGVGLARMEFIINEQIGIHPMALAHPERAEDAKTAQKLADLTKIYGTPGRYFVEKLTQGIGTIAAAFYPKRVLLRMSDLKTNEYGSLLGGQYFEPKEDNPMLGFRGAARYTHPAYADAFALECTAIRHVREELGLNNLQLMIPFCRSLKEGKNVLQALSDNGLTQGENGLEVHLMCEIPNNVLQIDAFAELFDGISIGTNDLTQLVLGVDRDSELVAFEFDEQDAGVLEMIERAIGGAKRHHRPVTICGQAVSDYPDFTRRLIKAGVDAITLNSDALLTTMVDILEMEKSMGTKTRGTWRQS